MDALCLKFEEISSRLKQTTQAREAAELRGDTLVGEVQTAELVTERQSALAQLHDEAKTSTERAALLSMQSRERQQAGQQAKELNSQLLQDCRQAALHCDSLHRQAASEERDAARERSESGAQTRQLRQVEADLQVIREDLRIAHQRQLLLQSELRGLESSLGSASRASKLAMQEGERLSQQIADRRRMMIEQERRLQALTSTADTVRQDGRLAVRTLAAEEAECKLLQAQLAALQQELVVIQEDVQAKTAGWIAESELVDTLGGELADAERQRHADEFEHASVKQALDSISSSLQTEKRRWDQANASKESASIRQARQAEDRGFEEVQGELKSALRHKEVLAADAAAMGQARASLSQRLRSLQPDLARAEERGTSLESSLALRTKEVEVELQKQRSIRDDVKVYGETFEELQGEESRLHSELAVLSARGAGSPRLGRSHAEFRALSEGPRGTGSDRASLGRAAVSLSHGFHNGGRSLGLMASPGRGVGGLLLPTTPQPSRSPSRRQLPEPAGTTSSLTMRGRSQKQVSPPGSSGPPRGLGSSMPSGSPTPAPQLTSQGIGGMGSPASSPAVGARRHLPEGWRTLLS